MSSLNSQFGDVDGAPYELPDLIKKLGDVRFGEPLTQDRLDMVDAIATHSRNVQELLLDGIRSVGHLMELTGCGEFEYPQSYIGRLGTFLKHVAGEADFLRSTESDMRQIIKDQTALQVKTKPAGRRTAGETRQEAGQ